VSAAPWLRRLLTGLLVAAALVFLALSVARNWGELRRFDWHVHPGWLALSIVAHVAVFAWGVVVWSRVLGYFRHPPLGFPALLRIWSLSNAARYIPGAVWQFFAAARLAQGAGISRVLLLTSLLIHVGFSLLAAALVAAATLPGELLGVGAFAPWVLIVALVAALLLVHPAVLNFGLRLVNRVAKRDVLTWHGTWTGGVGLLALQVASWLLYGAAFYLFIAAFVPVAPSALLPLGGVNALSFIAGYVVIVAPAGFGPREVTMAALLAPYAPAGVGVVLALGARLWTVAAELCTAALALLLTRGRTGTAASTGRAGRAAHRTP
jgi:uncharacterized membrane protein YbhN (UPF0104 family)